MRKESVIAFLSFPVVVVALEYKSLIATTPLSIASTIRAHPKQGQRVTTA
eukprot:SAG31_NODE_46638_length_253_cov_1.012987_1_plen_49_part_10